MAIYSFCVNFIMLNCLKIKFGINPQTKNDAAKAYKQLPSISEKLPWMEYDPKGQCFLLEDGRSVAAVFELSDAPTEARSEEYVSQLQKGLQGVFQDVFPSYFDNESPWIVQFYVQDELSLQSFYASCKNYIKSTVRNTKFTQTYLDLLKEHAKLATQTKGLFVDTKVSGLPFRGKARKIRAVIYRKLTGVSLLRRNRDAIQDLNAVAQTFVAKLESCGIKAKRYQGKDFYNWMVRWFNPAPRVGSGDSEKLIKLSPYPGDDEMPYGYDFSQALFFSAPKSDEKQGVWYFDNKPHKYLTVLGLNKLPKTGHFSMERQFGNYYFSLLDKFPAGSILQFTVILQNQDTVKNHLFRIEHSTKRASSTEADMAREDCAIAKRAIESSNYFFPTVMGVYLQGNDLNDLYDKEAEVETLLASNGLIHLSGDHELTPIDSYLRYLPMCYSFEFDKARLLRSRYLSGKQISQLLPLYGRERGTGNPGIVLFNRGGEPLTLDPMNFADKDFNSHLLLLGTTGSGKSALCIYLMMQLMAVYRPRLVVIDAGNSFGLLCDYFSTQGLTVNRVEISFKNPTSLNPFAESAKMLTQLKAKDDKLSTLAKEEDELEKDLKERSVAASSVDMQGGQENRDYMGEMSLAAQLMITGGERKEIDDLTRQDRYWILKAIIHAAQIADSEGRDQMIASDVIAAFYQLASLLEQNDKKTDHDTIVRLNKMAEHMSLFCQDTLSSQYFNTPGKPWADSDVLVFELGLFKDEGYEAHRALAFMGVMNKTISLAEQHQHEERFTVFFADECHVVTSNPLTAVAVTKCSKMSRKLGLWLWFATQNVRDFPDDARKMLSMMEFWICLGMSEVELEEVQRFKTLTEEEKALFRSPRKEAGKFVEGIILCNKFNALFKNVPPRLALALAMTEKIEKAERKRIMQQHNCSEVEAAIKVAASMILELSGG